MAQNHEHSETSGYEDTQVMEPHPVPGRYRVSVPVKQWPREAEPPPASFRYRAFTDEAAEAALMLAASADE